MNKKRLPLFNEKDQFPVERSGQTPHVVSFERFRIVEFESGDFKFKKKKE